MVLKYKSFLVNEANIKHMIKREDLKVGDDVMTNGTCDGVGLDYQIGKIIAMREYGNILVEFEKKFSTKLHSGAGGDKGKKKQCFYIKLENITSNNRIEFEKILDKIGKQKREESDRLNASYKEGDVIIGVGEVQGYRKLNVDGEVGIVYYDIGQAPAGGNNNRTYWVCFLDKFDNNLMKAGDNTPPNGAGYNVDKLHMRHITDEEREKVKDKLQSALKYFNDIRKPLEVGDVVKILSDYGGYKIKDRLGIIMTLSPYANYNGGLRNAVHNVKFLGNDIPEYLNQEMGLQLHRTMMVLATEEEIKDKEDELNTLKQIIKEHNHPYKVGDWIISYDKVDRAFDNQPGKIVKIIGDKPWENFVIGFLTHFSPKLRNEGKINNCAYLQRRSIKICKDPKIEEMIAKLETGKVKPFIASDMLITIMDRVDLRSSVPFFVQSYFDIGEKGDNITFLPIDKISRLEKGENPYKSRFRQPMGIGKFIRLLQPTLKERQIELLNNSFKTNYEIVTGVSDKLRLVSGEDVRFWYNVANYDTGGGILNSSCMKDARKGPEMQMFVDNPDVVQLLILTNENNKLIGRALIWRLVQPYGETYMDSIYTRFDKDSQLFQMYGKSRGWITRMNYGSNASNMVCALFNGKKYRQGVDALDHFDTFRLGHTHDYLTNSGSQWTRPKNLVKPKWEGAPDIENKTEESKPIIKGENNEPFAMNARVIYQKPGAVNNNKKGIFVGMKDDGKAKIVFDDGGKYALKIEYIKETD